MKKVIAGLGVAALAAMATPAFAANSMTGLDHSFGSIANALTTVVGSSNSNQALVSNYVDSSSSTGGNEIEAKEDNTNSVILSGDALSAVKLDNKVNTILSKVEVDNSCDCTDNTMSDIDHSFAKIYNTDATVVGSTNTNSALVGNYVDSSAKTGHNEIESEREGVDHAAIGSGDAASLAEIWSSVNTTSSWTSIVRD